MESSLRPNTNRCYGRVCRPRSALRCGVKQLASNAQARRRTIRRRWVCSVGRPGASWLSDGLDESRNFGGIDTAIGLVFGDDERALRPAPFRFWQDSVSTIPGLFFFPTATVGGIAQHSAVLPVISDAGVVVLDGEIGILGNAVHLQRVLVMVSHVLCVEKIGDDDLGLGPHGLTPAGDMDRSEEHTSELQSPMYLV